MLTTILALLPTGKIAVQGIGLQALFSDADEYDLCPKENGRDSFFTGCRLFGSSRPAWEPRFLEHACGLS